jgi:GT2 family glycosyltransferase
MTVTAHDKRSRNRTAAVVVTYNSASDIRDCLNALTSQNDLSIVVVDNGSEADQVFETQRICTEFECTSFLKLDNNLGFGAGVNRGVSFAVTHLPAIEFLWIVNPDTVPEQDALLHLRKAVVDGVFDVVSPLITTGDPTSDLKVWFAGGALDLCAMRTTHIGHGAPMPMMQEDSPCTFLTGAAVFMRLSTWQRLGGFSEEYFLYWEDADISYRALASGLRLGLVSKSKIWHQVGGSGDRSGKSAQYYFFMQRNRILFAKKLEASRRLLLGSGLIESIRLTLRPLKQSVEPRKKFAAGLRGIIAGWTINTDSFGKESVD